MPSLNTAMVLAFEDELEKQAINLAGLGQMARKAGGYLARQGTTAGAGAALGAVGGAGLGAGIGGVRGYREAKRQGATTGQALMHGAGKGLKGGLIGGAAGGALGGAAGLVGGGRAREMAGKLRAREGMLGGIARTGEREMHGLTGALPHTAEGALAGKLTPYGALATDSKVEALRSMNLGAAPAMKRVEEAKKALTGSWKDMGPKKGEKLQKELTSARAHRAASQQMEELGATNLPGYLKSLATRPLDTLSAGAREQWHGAGTGAMGHVSRGLTWGLPAAGAVGALRGPKDVEGEGRGARVGRAIGGAAYGVAGMPMLGISALTSLGTKAGGFLGRGVDASLEKRNAAKPLRKFRPGLLPPPGPEPEEADVYSPAVEHEYSSGATGMQEGEVR
jgi:hypothetical protein